MAWMSNEIPRTEMSVNIYPRPKLNLIMLVKGDIEDDEI